MKARRQLLCAMAITACLTVSACSSEQKDAAASTEEVEPVETSAQAVPEPTSDTTEAAGGQESDPAQTAPDTSEQDAADSDLTGGDGTQATQSPVLGEDVSGAVLTLTDVFKVEGEWAEGRFDVAASADVQGMAVNLTCYSNKNQPAEIELRLANKFTGLDMKVGQATNSGSSDNVLVVEVLSNGKQVDSRRVPFNVVQPFKESVTGANAVKLRFYLDTEDPQATCDQDGTTVVVQGLTVRS